MDPNGVLEPVMQYGFAGIASALLAALIWIVKMFIGSMKEHHDAVVALTKTTMMELHENTSVITSAFAKVHESHDKQAAVLDELHDKLLERPCILDREVALAIQKQRERDKSVG